jgi:type I restriction enzyme M protein
LPHSVFAPYTPVKTNILFFEKGSVTKKVWYYEVPLPAGVKAFSKKKPMKISAFDDCIKWWGAGDTAAAIAKRQQREANQYAWQVSIEDIKKRDYNLDIKNPHIVEQQNHDPKQLLTDYQQQQQQINNFQRQLKDILNNALVGAE